MHDAKKTIAFSIAFVCAFGSGFFARGVSDGSGISGPLNSIKISKANSERQMVLIAGLRETLKAREAELTRALNALTQSEADLTALKASLAKTRNFSKELSEYCVTLEKENLRLKARNKALGIGCGVSGGAAGVFLVLLLIFIL
jgi:hypothetical protein